MVTETRENGAKSGSMARRVAAALLLTGCGVVGALSCKNGSQGFEGGDCLDTTDDCAKTCGCKTLGRCKREGKTCVPVSDVACRASEACKTLGACSLAGDRCAPATEKDCAESSFCKVGHLCAYRDGHCVKPAEPSASPSAPALAP